jgi:hypothetical protein
VEPGVGNDQTSCFIADKLVRSYSGKTIALLGSDRISEANHLRSPRGAMRGGSGHLSNPLEG